MKSKDKNFKNGTHDEPKDIFWKCFQNSGMLSYYLLYKKMKDD